MPFLNGGECGDAGHKGNGDNGPEHSRNKEEEQKTCYFVGLCVRKAKAFADNQRRNLIDDFDGDNDPCPNPQPCRDLQNGYQPYGAASNQADVRHAVQHGTCLAFSMQFSRKVPIHHIAQAT